MTCFDDSVIGGPTPEAERETSAGATREEVERVLVAGNHLANALVMLAGTAYPPFTASADEGREWFYANLHERITASWVEAYDVWIGWRAAMRLARSIHAPAPAASPEGRSTVGDAERALLFAIVARWDRFDAAVVDQDGTYKSGTQRFFFKDSPAAWVAYHALDDAVDRLRDRLVNEEPAASPPVGSGGSDAAACSPQDVSGPKGGAA